MSGTSGIVLEIVNRSLFPVLGKVALARVRPSRALPSQSTEFLAVKGPARWTHTNNKKQRRQTSVTGGQRSGRGPLLLQTPWGEGWLKEAEFLALGRSPARPPALPRFPGRECVCGGGAKGRPGPSAPLPFAISLHSALLCPSSSAGSPPRRA